MQASTDLDSRAVRRTRRRVCGPLDGVALIALCMAAACATRPAPPWPRPALPIPPELAARYEVPGPVVERNLVQIGGDGDLSFWRGQLDAGPERAEFHVVWPAGHDPSAQQRPATATGSTTAADRLPFVLALPILAGGQEVMWIVAQDLAARGYLVAWPRRVESALKRHHRGAELEEVFRRSVVHARMLLAWARELPSVDGDRTAVFGVSLGSMIGAALMAVEPGLKAGALCLAGGDFPDMLMVSDEPRAVRWRRWRIEDDGLAKSSLRRELSRELRSDPARLGPYVATDRVFLVAAKYDTVVPVRHQDLLWESLGRPERMRIPFGHYTAAVVIYQILDAATAFFRARGC